MSKCAWTRRLAGRLAFGAASLCLMLSGPVMAQTAQQPTTTPATPMQQMEHGQGMGMSGQGHQGMMGGQGQQTTPMGGTPQCQAGQTLSGNPPTCR